MALTIERESAAAACADSARCSLGRYFQPFPTVPMHFLRSPTLRKSVLNGHFNASCLKRWINRLDNPTGEGLRYVWNIDAFAFHIIGVVAVPMLPFGLTA